MSVNPTFPITGQHNIWTTLYLLYLMEAFFSPFVRGSNRKIQGLCSTKGPPGKIHRGFYFRKNTQFRFQTNQSHLEKECREQQRPECKDASNQDYEAPCNCCSRVNVVPDTVPVWLVIEKQGVFNIVCNINIQQKTTPSKIDDIDRMTS